MVDPKIEIYESDDVTLWGGWTTDIPIDMGDESSVLELHIWNDKGGTLGSVTATNVEVVALDQNGGYADEMIQEKWVEISTSGPTGPFTPVGGTSRSTETAVQLPDIPSNAKQTIWVKINTPVGGSTRGNEDWQLRVRYQ